MKTVFLMDLDGTLYSGKNPLPYAPEFINYLNANNYKYLALTNCPSKTQKQVSKKLRAMKIDIAPDRILTSGMAAAKILSEKYMIESAFVLGTNALKQEFKKRGVPVNGKNARAVVVGYDTALTYKKLSRAVVLVNSGAMLFATNIDNDIPFGNARIPHTGAIAKAIEFAAGKECVYIGKPQPHMLEIACEMLDCDKSDCVMIGDRLDTDIAFAVNSGIESYHITNGFSLKEALEIVSKSV